MALQLHALLSAVAIVLAAIALIAALKRELGIVSGLAWPLAATVLLHNLAGWLAYPAYRIAVKPWLLENAPLVHTLFEFKEHLAWFTIPLSIALAFSLYLELDELEKSKSGRALVTIVSATLMLLLLLTTVLGILVTAVRAL